MTVGPVIAAGVSLILILAGLVVALREGPRRHDSILYAIAGGVWLCASYLGRING